jgi:hypothetical protein
MLAHAKKLVATTLISSTLILGGLAPMASAAPPIFQGGLVNVAVQGNNVIVDPQVIVDAQVPIGVAANVCNVSVAVLATLVAAPGDTSCDSTVNQRTESAFEQIQRIIAGTN